MRDIIIYVIIFYVGGALGFITHWWVASRTDYGGTIYITHNEEKTLYSLELSDYPESIEFKKQIVFKVDASEKES